MTKFSPLLSEKIFSGTPAETERKLSLIRFPCLVSVKWDGWRMFDVGGEARCRSMKPPKSKFVQEQLREFYAAAAKLGCGGVDGEILVGDPYSHNVMQATSSMCNSYEKTEPFTYQVFDIMSHAEKPFVHRLAILYDLVETLQPRFPFLRFTHHESIDNMDELMSFMDEVCERGGEGLMGRDPHGIYKFGRSTIRDGILWALKPYVDDECVILSLHERMHNGNEAVVNELGHTSRPGGRANHTGRGDFGYAVCKSAKFGETFRLGAGIGLTDALRAEIWANPEDWIGATIKFKYQAIGVKDRPRQPKWMGRRYAEDMAPSDMGGEMKSLIKGVPE